MLAESVRDLAGLHGRVRADGVVIISSAGHGLRPIGGAGSSALRPFGLAAGEFTLPDDFDAPLPDEIYDGFEGR